MQEKYCNEIKPKFIDEFGVVRSYDMACGVKFFKENNVKVDPSIFEFIGEGSICEVNGHPVEIDEKEWFWKRIR